MYLHKCHWVGISVNIFRVLQRTRGFGKCKLVHGYHNEFRDSVWETQRSWCDPTMYRGGGRGPILHTWAQRVDGGMCDWILVCCQAVVREELNGSLFLWELLWLNRSGLLDLSMWLKPRAPTRLQRLRSPLVSTAVMFLFKLSNHFDKISRDHYEGAARYGASVIPHTNDNNQKMRILVFTLNIV